MGGSRAAETKLQKRRTGVAVPKGSLSPAGSRAHGASFTGASTGTGGERGRRSGRAISGDLPKKKCYWIPAWQDNVAVVIRSRWDVQREKRDRNQQVVEQNQAS